MEYLQTENKIEKLVADVSCNKEPELHRMQLSSPKEKLLKQGIDQDYEKRLSTFSTWPYENVISHKKLAKAGFFYEGNGDEVQCYSCGVKVKDWKPSDIAVRKHQELFPNCSYIASIFNKASKRSEAGLITNILNSNPQQVQAFSPSPNIYRNRFPSVGTASAALRTSVNACETVKTVLPSSTAISSPQNQNISTLNGAGAIEKLPNFEKMKSEEERLKTFNFGWPVISPKPCELAREGFFYLLERDRVQCVFCRGVVSHWEPTDDPLREHARHFPFCPFVMGRDVGNIPSSKYSPSYRNGIDVCGSNHWKNSGPENGSMPLSEKKLEKLENFGVKLHHGPKHPSQASKDARFRSFVGWPTSSPIQPKALVEAGFFYIGIQDYTRCFYCDGGLCNWEANDDPWEEHARWFQHCAYVRLNKGDAWVEACLKKSCSVQKSILQPPSQQHTIIPTTSAVIDIPSRVEELMNSSIVSSAVELGIFPVDLIRAALLKRIQTVGSNFSSDEEIYDSVIKLQQEMEQNNSSTNAMETSMENITENVKESEISVAASEGVPSPGVPTTKDKVISPVEDIIKEQRLCKICMDKEIGVLFLPCGHLMSCVECGPAMTICPFCRQTIRGTVRAFLT